MWARQHPAGGSWSPIHITWPVAWIAFFGQTLVALPSKAQNEQMFSELSVPISPYRDVFGNWCSRIVAPAGRIRLWADGVVNDTGRPDSAAPWAAQHAVEGLPAATLNFLLASRYCETDRPADGAWGVFV